MIVFSFFPEFSRSSQPGRARKRISVIRYYQFLNKYFHKHEKAILAIIKRACLWRILNALSTMAGELSDQDRPACCETENDLIESIPCDGAAATPAAISATDVCADSAGLLSIKSLFILILWYLFSFSALFLNKYILESRQGELVLFSK